MKAREDFSKLNPKVAEQFECFISGNPDGRISHAKVGTFTVKTLTVAQAETLLKDGYPFLKKKIAAAPVIKESTEKK